jgi:hypothetical protein
MLTARVTLGLGGLTTVSLLLFAVQLLAGINSMPI